MSDGYSSIFLGETRNSCILLHLALLKFLFSYISGRNESQQKKLCSANIKTSGYHCDYTSSRELLIADRKAHYDFCIRVSERADAVSCVWRSFSLEKRLMSLGQWVNNSDFYQKTLMA